MEDTRPAVSLRAVTHGLLVVLSVFPSTLLTVSGPTQYLSAVFVPVTVFQVRSWNSHHQVPKCVSSLEVGTHTYIQVTL